MATRIAEYFQFKRDWYRAAEVAALVLEYYVVLRSLLRTKPHLPVCLARCRHCGIYFPTHRRNAGRRDLGCLFGCREAHRRKASTQRSVAYYQADPDKKQRQNAKRRGRAATQKAGAIDSSPGSRQGVEPETSTQPAPAAGHSQSKAAGPMFTCPAALAAALPKAADLTLMDHIRVVLSVIEERPVSLAEIWEMLVQTLRQRTMVRRRKIDHAVSWLNEEPP